MAIVYSSGYFGVALISFSVGTIPQVFYVPEKGSALIAGLTIGGGMILGNYLFGLLNWFGRLIDGILDPWIGNLSDYWKGKYGRRKPFILIGTPLMGLFFILFVTPPSNEASFSNLWWLAFIYPMFFLFYTMCITPYLAMIPEITRTAKQRLLVTSLQSVFLILGTFAAVFTISAIPDGLSFVKGSILIAVFSAIPLLIVALAVKIPDETWIDSETVRPSTIAQIRSALGFRPFRIYLISIILFFFGFEMVKASARYVAINLLGDLSHYKYILGIALGVAALNGIGAYWIGRKIGKRKSMILMSVLFFILLPFVGMVGKGFLSSDTAAYALFGLMGIPISFLLVIPNSLLADVIDLNNEQSGEKREGLFFASQALLNKIGIAFSKMTLNFLLPIGAMGTAAVGEQGVRMIGPAAAIFIFIGMLVFLKFPDVEKRD